jgi:hypothetical protein
MSAMRARHSALEQFMANVVEYESSTERMVIRQRIHLDAARALRELRPRSSSTMPARSCTELGAAMIALRVAELRKEAVATRAAASIEMELETSTSRFALRGIHPEAAKALREIRIAGR